MDRKKRDPRKEPRRGDIVEKEGRRYLPVRRVVLGTEGPFVLYRSGGKEKEMRVWISTWLGWAMDAQVVKAAEEIDKQPEEERNRNKMSMTLGAFELERDAHGWTLIERRPSKDKRALEKNPDAVSETKKFYQTIGGCLKQMLEREVALGGEDCDGVAQISHEVDRAFKTVEGYAEKIELQIGSILSEAKKANKERRTPERPPMEKTAKPGPKKKKGTPKKKSAAKKSAVPRRGRRRKGAAA